MRFDIMECGIRIRAMREDLHYTHMQFADQLNISLDHLKSIERGRRAEIDYYERRTVLIYCGYTVDYSVGADLPGVTY